MLIRAVTWQCALTLTVKLELELALKLTDKIFQQDKKWTL